MRNTVQTACFTGHRIIATEDLPLITKRLDKVIAELVGQGLIFFGVGGALGFDTLAAHAVLRARERNFAIRFIMVLPCHNQHKYLTETDKQAYRQLLNTADKVVCLSEVYYDGCMKKRNLHLIQHSSVCVAYMKHERSGSAQTVRLAREHGLAIINLADN